MPNIKEVKSLNWYPDRKYLVKEALEGSVDVKSRFKIMSKRSYNATSALLRHDFIEVCSSLNTIPILLPKVDENFTENLCSLVWNIYKNDTAIVKQFCKSQPHNRCIALQKEIDDMHSYDILDRVPDIGLYDAYQILSLSNDRVVLMSLEADPFFTKKHQSLLLGINFFLQKSKDAVAILAVSLSKETITKQKKKHPITAYNLPNINAGQFIDHAIDTAKKVSPHLDISKVGTARLYSLCSSAEEFISRMQEMVLYQKESLVFPDTNQEI